ncbi:ribonuclease Z, mitochondrial isoform X2 [Dendroctonus ponderosae]|uniref:Zinc phosphodiesterase ELAC protein 2 n=1 Tax=Dendroctonus ponderosae TaxID=77166 RepID=A0AAR5QAK2_DENPD|nr:ribonuclease Z, mitochondrial isoform X2 [Dendroctonus ponderosae]
MNIFLKPSVFRFVVLLTTRSYSKYRTFDNSNLNLLLTKMPKEPTHIAVAQKQRLKIKQKSAKYTPGRVTLQILGTGANGAPGSVYLFSDQSRYLFNCGEGTQRLAHEHKTKLAKLEHIFITQPKWKNIGGLPGTALTIQDVGVPQITLHGPEGLNEIFPATRRFVVIRDLKINMADCSETTTFEDNALRVEYVHLHKSVSQSGLEKDVQASVEQSEAGTSTRSEKKRSSSISSRNGESLVEDDTDYYAHEQSGRRPAPSAKSISSATQMLLKGFKSEAISMCYICRLQPRPGALNLDKCVKNGVPPGPLLGLLKNGEDVTLGNGTVVKSVDVCEPDDPGPIFLVVDCPSADYLESLASNPRMKKHQKFAQFDDDAACLVVHFTPKDVMELPLYKRWMEDFTPSTQHIQVNDSNSCMGSTAVHRIQYKLNLLSPDFFPLLGDRGTPSLCETFGNHQNKKQKSEDINFANLNLDIAPANNCKTVNENRSIGSLSSYYLRPKKGFDSTSHINLDTQEFIDETMSLPQFSDALKELHQKLQIEKSNYTIRDYPQVLFLGTGSCIPNKTRNTSGILLQISDTKNILLDCGEGTCGQITRFFGQEKANKVLTEIDAIYISHLHADHHIGLIGVLQGRRKALDLLRIEKAPLILFAPRQILAWLAFYDRFFENIKDEYVLVPNGELILNETTFADEKRIKILSNLDMSDISTCLVRHCPNAFGVSITHESGYKITYSGDTMPSEKLVELGKNSDVLIHEATMEDELAKEAVVKMHSTTSQAIQVGKDMKAKHVILTHFSQRYAKLPRFNDNFADNVSIAFDNMQVKLDELPLVPLLYPALKIMFADHYEQLEHKAVKRQLKAERQAFLEQPKLQQNQS